MKKNLKQLDPVYSSVINYMSKKERISYCESLIKETEEFVKGTKRPLDERTRARYEEIIEAAKTEMEVLTGEN